MSDVARFRVLLRIYRSHPAVREPIITLARPWEGPVRRRDPWDMVGPLAGMDQNSWTATSLGGLEPGRELLTALGPWCDDA